MTGDKTYVEQRDGGYRITSTRISLESLVYAFRRGTSPESIRRSFPILTIEEVYGAITFYLAHEQAVDDYLEESEHGFKARAGELNARTPSWEYVETRLRRRLRQSRVAADEEPPARLLLTPGERRR